MVGQQSTMSRTLLFVIFGLMVLSPGMPYMIHKLSQRSVVSKNGPYSSSTALPTRHRIRLPMPSNAGAPKKAPQVCLSPFCRECTSPSSQTTDFAYSLLGGASSRIDSSLFSGPSNEGAVFFERQQRQPVANWKERLLNLSNYASILCVVDCTLLPLVTLLLPALGVLSGGSIEWLHDLGHALALYFVLPVGASATFLNYRFSHRRVSLAAVGSLGLALVAAANAGHGFLAVIETWPLIGTTVHTVLTMVHHGLAHRLTNLAGCALLISQNVWSKRIGGCGNTGCQQC